MDLGLAGRKALVTGGSQGIGRGCGLALAQEGCEVALVSRTLADLERAREEIVGRTGAKVRVSARDLSDPAQVDALAAEFPDIDILVNNAGSIPAGPIESLDDAAWREGWQLKVFGYIHMTRRFLAPMKARRSGVIINVIGNRLQNPNHIAGETGNMALANFTVTLGAETPDWNVRVVGLDPGPIATERLLSGLRKAAKAAWGDEERYVDLVGSMPFGRAGRVEEVAATVAFLASDLAGYITGCMVTVDGGVGNRSRAGHVSPKGASGPAR